MVMVIVSAPYVVSERIYSLPVIVSLGLVHDGFLLPTNLHDSAIYSPFYFILTSQCSPPQATVGLVGCKLWVSTEQKCPVPQDT